jgi:hypothetical protein
MLVTVTKVCQARQVSEVGTDLLSSSSHYSLQSTHSLRLEGYTTVQICIIEILLQHCVETL